MARARVCGTQKKGTNQKKVAVLLFVPSARDVSPLTRRKVNGGQEEATQNERQVSNIFVLDVRN